MLFFFIYLITRDSLTALLTSIIFCVHPMTADMVQHITFNILLLQAVFMEFVLMSLYLYSQSKKRIYCYVLCLIVLLIALFCQETSLLLPLYAAALLFFLTDLKLIRTVELTAPFIIICSMFILLWLAIIDPHVHLESMGILRSGSFWSSMANFSHLFFWYLSNLFVPRDIEFMCNFPPLTDHLWGWNSILLVFLTACGLLIFYYFKRSVESFALCFFLIGFIYALIASQALSQDGKVCAFEPNWVFFSSIGFYLLLILTLMKIGKNISKPLFIILLSVLFFYYFSSTASVNVMSRTEKSYTERWLRNFPENPIARKIVAAYYSDHNASEIPVDFIPDMMGQEDDYIKDDDPRTFALAARLFKSKTSIVQKNELLMKLAVNYCKGLENEKCSDSIKRIVVSFIPRDEYLQLSNLLYVQGDGDKAKVVLQWCILKYPKYKEAYLLIGVILANEGRYDESIDYWKTGAAIDPADPRFKSNIDRARLNKLYELKNQYTTG